MGLDKKEREEWKEEKECGRERESKEENQIVINYELVVKEWVDGMSREIIMSKMSKLMNKWMCTCNEWVINQ